MGKSALIRELGRILDVQPITAIRFMLSKSPERFLVAGKPLLIDGLDEAMARREGDAIDKILSQLEAAGSPNFILSCRAREWQSRTTTGLRQVYAVAPTVITLQPLNRKEAIAFLIQRYPAVNSDHVLSHLDENGISDLYNNPLTLSLMGRVAETDSKLPATRASLFARTCTLIWPEHDPERQDSRLGTIIDDQALSSAGAIMAGLLFSGAETITLSALTGLQEGDIRLADLSMLPDAGTAPVIFSSKLFCSVGVGRAKPIHRVIAEFLSARWLARQATTRRRQRRLLSKLHGGGAVPASLRGVHAWLAYHSATLAKAVIAADPFGVLRYGETADLSSEQAGHLFDSLQALAETDPYFRAQDWDSHTTAGLMISSLKENIETTIASTASNGHWRSLLIEGLNGTALAGDLANTLEIVMLSTERFYRERRSSALALKPYRDGVWWQQTINELHDQGTEDSTRLARDLIEELGCCVTDELLVAAVFAEMGVTISPLPRIRKRRTHTIRHYGQLIESLPAGRLKSILNLISEYASLLSPADWENHNDVAEIASSLMVRAIDADEVGPRDAALLWNWLGILQRAERFRSDRDAGSQLQMRLDQDENLRRAIQQHALYVARRRATIWSLEVDLRRRMVGLAVRPWDIAWFLEQMTESDKDDRSVRTDWCDLMRLGVDGNGLDPDVQTAGHKFRRGDPQLTAFVRKIKSRKKPAWEYRQERENAKRERKQRVKREICRRQYVECRAELRIGELDSILAPARVYLGNTYESSHEAVPMQRLVDWMGAELLDDAMAGFEAVLHRSDIPSPGAVAESFASRQIWNYCFPIMAGLLARLRANRDLNDVPADVLTIGLLLCYQHSFSCADKDLSALTASLEQRVLQTVQSRENFVRLWVEPSLAAKASHIPGLYKLVQDEQWLEIGAALVSRWLVTYPDLPDSVELELVDCLTRSKALDLLANVAAARATEGFQSEKHRFAWLAIDVLVRFDTVKQDLSHFGVERPEFIWDLRDRFQLRGGIFPLSIPQAKWIVSQFRSAWPYSVMIGSSSGDRNPFDATDFIRAVLNRLADDTGADATEALQELVSAPVDSYSDLVRHMAAEQRQKRAEEEFSPLQPKELGELLSDGPPSNIDDLKSIVLEELAIAQQVLLGDDLDQVRDFWRDSGIPYDENRCRDRLAAIIGPELRYYDIQRITEADMPKTKRADLAFARGRLQLPMEVKGQWHPEVWAAATDQLDTKYLVDWRSEQRGIYCVLWFGNVPSSSRKRLKGPPAGIPTPKSADEMRNLLTGLIPECRRSLIDVIVLDLSAGNPLFR
jgi:hypothetical protein